MVCANNPRYAIGVLEPYLGLGADVGEPERFMDTYASRAG